MVPINIFFNVLDCVLCKVDWKFHFDVKFCFLFNLVKKNFLVYRFEGNIIMTYVTFVLWKIIPRAFYEQEKI